MRVIYLPSALPDLVWFRAYYSDIFPEGEKHALLQRRAVERLIRENPFIGKSLDADSEARAFPILRTPFRFVYLVKEDRIEVLRVWDNRRDPSGFQF
ncbi:type II toxin-antitoxin system RelE/ParE family toxin [Rhizobium sp. TH2]|uniref:type II toxin-antitoxin system RelE/ParE family toxin n=1 Tax=Rhizobium sp. TH2 TaxID=2775403 RepID=UPI0021582EE9|nr:type II toxin-antitoxin system RelE/ParE family toxin [Rhizobium sp. TH2]UVC07820.1 type II toxin-antitoxin system RelE/ParE family toxin [Rhizobium sp. TH2]